MPGTRQSVRTRKCQSVFSASDLRKEGRGGARPCVCSLVSETGTIAVIRLLPVHHGCLDLRQLKRRHTTACQQQAAILVSTLKNQAAATLHRVGCRPRREVAEPGTGQQPGQDSAGETSAATPPTGLRADLFTIPTRRWQISRLCTAKARCCDACRSSTPQLGGPVVA